MRVVIVMGILVVLLALGGGVYWFVSNLFISDPNDAIVDQFLIENGLLSGELLTGSTSTGEALSGSGAVSFDELVDMFSGETLATGTATSSNESSEYSTMTMQQLQSLSPDQLKARRLQHYQQYKAIGSGDISSSTHSSATEPTQVETQETAPVEEFTIETIQE